MKCSDLFFVLRSFIYTDYFHDEKFTLNPSLKEPKGMYIQLFKLQLFFNFQTDLLNNYLNRFLCRKE